MPELPWMTGSEPTMDGEVHVMASRFTLSAHRHVLPFFIDALRIHLQVRRAPGAVGVALIARPLRKEFYTLSAWQNRSAIDDLVAAEPHRSVMVRYRDHTADSHFAFWTTTAPTPPSWDEAYRRLAT